MTLSQCLLDHCKPLPPKSTPLCQKFNTEIQVNPPYFVSLYHPGVPALPLAPGGQPALGPAVLLLGNSYHPVVVDDDNVDDVDVDDDVDVGQVTATTLAGEGPPSPIVTESPLR